MQEFLTRNRSYLPKFRDTYQRGKLTTNGRKIVTNTGRSLPVREVNCQQWKMLTNSGRQLPKAEDNYQIWQLSSSVFKNRKLITSQLFYLPQLVVNFQFGGQLPILVANFIDRQLTSLTGSYLPRMVVNFMIINFMVINFMVTNFMVVNFLNWQ